MNKEKLCTVIFIKKNPIEQIILLILKIALFTCHNLGFSLPMPVSRVTPIAGNSYLSMFNSHPFRCDPPLAFTQKHTGFERPGTRKYPRILHPTVTYKTFVNRVYPNES